MASVSLKLAVSILFVSCVVVLKTQSSTLGVEYLSRLLEIHDLERASPVVQVAAARGVLERLLPSHLDSFEFRTVSKVSDF